MRTCSGNWSRDLAATIGYSGSHGANLRISRNLNQPVAGVRPFPVVAASSPILPGTPLGNITQVETSGFSNYYGVWAAMTKRLSRGLQVDASYTWSKSLDTNSLNSSGFAVQDGYDIPSQYGLSDFDARHRFVLSATYLVPFTGHALTRGWQLATVVQSQSGNPVNIVTSNSSLNGVPNSVRPDVTGPIRIIGSVDQWFDPSAFVAGNHFGNLGRNVVIGPELQQCRPVVDQEHSARKGPCSAVSGGCLRRVQPSQLRPARQYRRQPDLRQDYEDATSHGRSRLIPPDSTGGATGILRWLCECVRAWCSRSPRLCVRAREPCQPRHRAHHREPC